MSLGVVGHLFRVVIDNNVDSERFNCLCKPINCLALAHFQRPQLVKRDLRRGHGTRVSNQDYVLKWKDRSCGSAHNNSQLSLLRRSKGNIQSRV